MKWLLIAAILSVMTLSDAPEARAWTLWVKYDASVPHANRAPVVSRRWERRQTAMTYERCFEDKRRLWVDTARSYADLSRYPAIDSVDSSVEETIFIKLKRRDGLAGGYEEQHFHCLADNHDPR